MTSFGIASHARNVNNAEGRTSKARRRGSTIRTSGSRQELLRKWSSIATARREVDSLG